jgi:hypothetical protein
MSAIIQTSIVGVLHLGFLWHPPCSAHKLPLRRPVVPLSFASALRWSLPGPLLLVGLCVPGLYPLGFFRFALVGAFLLTPGDGNLAVAVRSIGL